MKNPLVSIIIATKNEEKNIENCIKSIREQTYKNIEIIVVDNNSSDKTKEIAGKLVDKIYDISKEVNLSKIKNFRGAQVNFGVSKCKGEIIFFPDADMTFSNDLCENAVSLLFEYDALFIPEHICGNGYFGKIRRFEREFYNTTVIDGIRFVKKSIFNKIGGFDVYNIVFGPDDWDITKSLKRINAKFAITTSMLFHHEEWLTLKKYVEKKQKYINTFDGYIKKWGKEDIDIKKQFGFCYRFFGVFMENGKWKRLLRYPYLALGMYFLRFLVGINFLKKQKLI